MANIDLNTGEKFRLVRVGGVTMIADASDSVNTPTNFRNKIIISASELSGHTSNAPYLHMVTNTNGPAMKIETDDFSTATHCIELQHNNTNQNHHLSMRFHHTSQEWSMGVLHGSGANGTTHPDKGNFIISAHDNIQNDATRCLMINTSQDVIVPGKFAVGFNTNGSESPGREFEVHANDDDDFLALIRNEATSADAHCLRLRIDATTPDTTNRFLQFDKTGGSGIDFITGDGAGGARFTGQSNGTYSDMRNKQNIVYLKEDNYCAGDILKQLDVLEYELKTDVRPVKLRHVGFSAQQLLELWPYPVTKFDKENEETGAKPGDSNFKYHKLNQGEMTPLIVKTIQEQMKTIELLTSRVEELEKKLEK